MLVTENLLQVTWHCIHFVSLREEATLRAKLDGSGLLAFDIQGSSIATEEDLFFAIAKELRFPEYFGKNWDALDECLSDMQWLPSKGYVLFVRDAEQFWRRASRIAGAFVEAWLFAAEEWSRHGVPFHLVFLWS